MVLLWLFGAMAGLYAQNGDVPFDKDLFKHKKDEFKEAVKAIKEADGLVEIDGAYHHALELYLKAYELNPNSSELNFKIGVCFMLSPNEDRTEALEYFQKAYQLNKQVSNDIHFYLGRGHHLKAEWDTAIEEYRRYSSAHGNAPPIEEYASIYKRIEECEVGKKLSQKPVRVFIDNVGSNVNSPYPDFGPVINADETLLLFTSRREGSTGGDQDRDFHYFEDIYMAEADEPGQWKKAVNIGKNINSNEHDATVGVSPDGSRMIVYREGDLYECLREEEGWSKPEKLSKNINTKYLETAATYSFDTKKLYFTSNRPDLSKGGLDIFVTELDEKGKWGDPQNLGFTLNTEYDEEGIFLHPDGRTMYFSSRGHESMGGYDIFKSVYDKGKWSVPENLGYPINTPDEDVYFVIDATGKRAYYTSAKRGGQGEKDLYKITMLGPDKPFLMNTEDNLLASVDQPIANVVAEPIISTTSITLTLFKGTILDEDTRDPVGATIEITDNSTGEVITSLKANSQTGKFVVTLPAGRNYGIAVKAAGYLFHSENFDIPENNGYLEVEKTILLKKIREGQTIVLRNIFFDFDKSTLRPESKKELENLLGIMQDNPTIKVELSGHTDSKGSAEYNKGLSLRRSQAVVKYLLDKGIAAERMESAGYGFDKPIATNDTDEGRQLNRRTELKILKK